MNKKFKIRYYQYAIKERGSNLYEKTITLIINSSNNNYWGNIFTNRFINGEK